MSSDDDWANQLDSDEEEEKKKEEEAKKKKAAFEGEDEVDPEELAKKKKEELKKQQEEQMANARVKSTKKVDYDKVFEERQAKLGGAPVQAKQGDDSTKNMSKAAKGMVLEQEAEKGLANQLFGDVDDDATPVVQLNSEKDYKEFAKKIAGPLYAGHAPYRIEFFFKELARDLPKHCDSKQIKKIADSMESLYNSKLKQEKEEIQGKKKKKPAALKGGGGKGYEMNNNPAMINDVMGADDDYGDEYGDYGNEKGFQRESEAAYDFI